MAECYKKQKSWSKAIDCYSELLAKYPSSEVENRDTKIMIMDCYLADNQPDKALSIRRQLLAEDTTDEWKLCYILGRRYVWQHEYGKAILELKRAVDLGPSKRDDPDLKDAKARLLRCYVTEKRWHEAGSLLDQLAAEYPEDKVEWSFVRGQCYQASAKLDQAIEEFRQAFELARNNRVWLREIGKALFECYLSVADLDGAASIATTLQSALPTEAASWQLQLGRVYRSRDEFNKALPCLRSVIEGSTKRWEVRSAQIYLGECLCHLGKKDEAIAGLTDYYKKQPDLQDEFLLVHSAVLYHGTSDYEGALALSQRLLSDYPNSGLRSTAQELAVAALEQLGRWNEAAVILEQIASTEKNDGMVKYQIGNAYFHAGKRLKAIKAFRDVSKDLTIDKETRADAAYQMALCYQDMGLPNAAKRLIEELCRQYPDTNAARKARGSMYLSSGGDDQRSVE